MKTRNWIVGSILAGSMLSLGIMGVANACGGPGGHARGDRMMHVMQQLDLTKDQRQAIRSIKDEQRDQMRANGDAMMDIRKSLREQVHAANYDAVKVRELADAKAKIMADMTVQRSATMHRIRQQLTAEQLVKLGNMQPAGPGRGHF